MGIYEIVRASGSANPLLPAPADIIWSAVVFSILLVFFWFKVLPNFKKNIDARTAAIEGRLAEAEKAQAAAAEKTANIEAEQAAARAERADTITKAIAEASVIKDEIIVKAHAEADAYLENAKKQIEAERQAAIISLRNEVGTLAVELAGAVVKQNLKEDKNAAGIVDDFLNQLERDGKTN
jgi:F-type H+-transporting ATPase subunit b